MTVAWARVIYDINQELAHAGGRAMRRLICDRFIWHGIARDIRRLCMSCQRAKVTKHVKAPVDQYPVPTNRFKS